MSDDDELGAAVDELMIDDELMRADEELTIADEELLTPDEELLLGAIEDEELLADGWAEELLTDG